VGEVIHDAENRMFTLDTDGFQSRMKYREISDTELEYYTTFVPEELRGRGIAQIVVKAALDYARQNGFKVKPTCSFVDKYMQKNKQYADLRIG